MKKILLMVWVCLFLSCKENASKKGTKISEKQRVTSVDIQQKEENSAEEYPELTTENAIPFLYEYEQKNRERKVRIITQFGNIDIELYKETPYHRANFIFLVKQKYFNGTSFHRVVNNFIIQGGNSDSWETSRKRRDIGYYLLPPDTQKGFRHDRGTLSMPSSDIDNPHQFASPYEFFIVCQKPGAYHLDKNYTAFGKVINGMEVVDKINRLEVDERELPKQNITMKMEILE